MPETRIDNRKNLLIIVLLCIISSAARFAIDSYLPSLPAMSLAFHTSGQNIQLTMTVYTLGFGVSQLIYGPLSDYWGRKKTLIIGLVLFLLANTFSTFTQALPVLLFFRGLAGIGIGACGVLNRAIASDCFTGPGFSKAWSYTTTTLVIVLALAPFTGSVIQQYLGWQANVAVSSLFISMVLIAVLWKLPETNPYCKIQRKSLKHIALDYYLILRTTSFIPLTLCYSLAFAGLIAYFQISPLLFIQIFHLTPIEYGTTTLLIAICYLVGGQIVNKLSHRLGTQKLLISGIFLLILSSIIMFAWNDLFSVSVQSILFPVALYVIGARIVIPNALAGAFMGLRHLAGSTSGIVGCIQMLSAGLVSLIISRCDYRSPLPLAGILLLLGVSMLIAYYLSSRKVCVSEID